MIAGTFVIFIESLIPSILCCLDSWSLQDLISITAWEVIWISFFVLPFAVVGVAIGGVLGERFNVKLPKIIIGVIVGTVVAICFGGLCFWLTGIPVLT